MELKEIIYFDEPGPLNTDEILKMARKRVEELGINHVVIASQAGFTVKRLLEFFKDQKINILVITNSTNEQIPVSFLYSKYEGSKRIKEDYEKRGITHFRASISEEDRKKFENEGVRVYYIQDYLNLRGIWELDQERKREGESASIRAKLSPFIPPHIRPLDVEAGMDLSLLSIISQGFRVCVGIGVVAVKNGFIPGGETILAIAGTGFAGGGADTAIILQAHSNPKACMIKEIIGFPKLK